MPSVNKILSNVVDNVFLKSIGTQVVVIIRRRVAKGEFLPGTTSNEYSTKPFAMPLGAAMKSIQGKITKEDLNNKMGPSRFQIFHSKNNGELWVLILGGYKQYRALGGRQNSKVDLNWTGRMLRNLGITQTNVAQSEIEVGFTSEEEKKKAFWHNVVGAGKSHSKHVFMGLTDSEVKYLTDFAGEAIAKKINDSLLALLGEQNQAA
jgi:hypothetical protein